MKIALSTFNSNLSVAFDFADTLLIFTVEDGVITDKKEYSLENTNLVLRTTEIKNLNVNVLICGCISRCSYEILTQSGIKIISHVSGPVDEIISAYLKNKILNEKFSMPGFGYGNGKGGRCGQKRGAGRGRCGQFSNNPVIQ